MTAEEIRQKYLAFFKKRNHTIIPRASLVPRGDPSTLFTGSGMQPMVPYLLGQKHPDGQRLVNSQICFRSQDIDEVGDSEHTTIFEMLGNWSLGDYFKSDQIAWIAEFLFDVVGLDPNKVYVSCYVGNKKYGIPRDEDAITLWQAEFKKRGIEAKVVEIGASENGDKQGMQGGRIFLYDGKENWWSRSGDEEGTTVGDPCGPDSEMFYDFGESFHNEAKWGKAHPANASPRFFEIGNNVFMGYRKTETGFEKLASPNIDHGSGLERIAAAARDDPDIFAISLFAPIIQKIENISGKKYQSHKESMQVIADHVKASVFLAADGVSPTNKEQGYVARRLIRRAILKAFNLGIEQDFIEQIVPVIAELYEKDYPEIAAKKAEIAKILIHEERIFRQTLRQGLKMFEKLTADYKTPYVLPVTSRPGKLTGEDMFKLYDTYGFPAELSKEEAFKREITVADDADNKFEVLMRKQRQRSQTATKGIFKGGLADNSEETKKLHTATHLMYEALRQVLGQHVTQRGSNVTAERTRFDFSHDQKVTREQLDEVEKIVNQQIEKDLKVSWQEEPTDQAFKNGAKGAFGDKYGEKVKVYTMSREGEKPFSIEICGGPHVEHTGQLGEEGKHFKITKEEASSAGVRRIKAVLA